MSVLLVPIGFTCTMDGLDLPFKLKKRLEALGMIEGTRIKVLNKKNNGALIIKFRGTRFAIGKSIAEKIAVRM